MLQEAGIQQSPDLWSTGLIKAPCWLPQEANRQPVLPAPHCFVTSVIKDVGFGFRDQLAQNKLCF